MEGALVLVVSTVNCLSTNYVLSLAIVLTSNFAFSRLFAFITSAPPYKILAATLSVVITGQIGFALKIALKC